MHTAPELFARLYGSKQPDISGFKLGDQVVYCGHCGHQREKNHIGFKMCPDCGKIMTIGTVTEEDLK